MMMIIMNFHEKNQIQILAEERDKRRRDGRVRDGRVREGGLS
jgi:hypothetical protein